jgi:hypothetical protein
VTELGVTYLPFALSQTLAVPSGFYSQMSSGFYSQNGRWPDPKSSRQKGGAGYFPRPPLTLGIY